ncbi:MAG: Lrp/AsnC family transcriptional regulator [Asticcacaulis sp.]
MNATKTHPTTQNVRKSARKPTKPLDAFDRAILRIIQKDNKTPQRTIASEVNLSAAAVQRRIAAMEDAGIITANVALIDPWAVQLSITAVVEVQLRDERASTVDAAKALFRSAKDVQQCYYMTGGVSCVLVIVTEDMRSYDALARRLFSESELVERFRTLIALDRVKTDTSVLVPPL